MEGLSTKNQKVLQRALHSLLTSVGWASAVRFSGNPFPVRMDSEEQWLGLDTVVGNVGTCERTPKLSLRRVCP